MDRGCFQLDLKAILILTPPPPARSDLCLYSNSALKFVTEQTSDRYFEMLAVEVVQSENRMKWRRGGKDEGHQLNEPVIISRAALRVSSAPVWSTNQSAPTPADLREASRI